MKYRGLPTVVADFNFEGRQKELDVSNREPLANNSAENPQDESSLAAGVNGLIADVKARKAKEANNHGTLTNRDHSGAPLDEWTHVVDQFNLVYAKTKVLHNLPDNQVKTAQDAYRKQVYDTIYQEVAPIISAEQAYRELMRKEIERFKNSDDRGKGEALAKEFAACTDVRNAREVYDKVIDLMNVTNAEKRRLRNLKRLEDYLLRINNPSSAVPINRDDERVLDTEGRVDDPVVKEFAITTAYLDHSDNSFREQLDKLGPFGAITVYKLGKKIEEMRGVLERFRQAAINDSSLFTAVDFTPDPELAEIRGETFWSNTFLILILATSPALLVGLAINQIISWWNNTASWTEDLHSLEHDNVFKICALLSPTAWLALAINGLYNVVTNSSGSMLDHVDFTYIKNINAPKLASNLSFILLLCTSPLVVVLLADFLYCKGSNWLNSLGKPNPAKPYKARLTFMEDREAAITHSLFWGAVCLSPFGFYILGEAIYRYFKGGKTFRERWLQYEDRKRDIQKFSQQLQAEEDLLIWKKAEILVTDKTSIPDYVETITDDAGVKREKTISLFDQFQKDVRAKIVVIKIGDAYKNLAKNNEQDFENAGAYIHLCRSLMESHAKFISTKYGIPITGQDGLQDGAVLKENEHEIIKFITLKLTSKTATSSPIASQNVDQELALQNEILDKLSNVIDVQLSHYGKSQTDEYFLAQGYKFYKEILQAKHKKTSYQHNPLIIGLVYKLANIYKHMEEQNNSRTEKELSISADGYIDLNPKNTIANQKLDNALAQFSNYVKLLGKVKHFQQNLSQKTKDYFKLQFYSHADPQISQGQNVQEVLDSTTKMLVLPAYDDDSGNYIPEYVIAPNQDMNNVLTRTTIDNEAFAEHVNVQKFEGLWTGDTIRQVIARRAVNTDFKARQSRFIIDYMQDIGNLMADLLNTKTHAGEKETKLIKINKNLLSLEKLVNAYEKVLTYNTINRNLMDSDNLEQQYRETLKLKRFLAEKKTLLVNIGRDHKSSAETLNKTLDDLIRETTEQTKKYVATLERLSYVVAQETRDYIQSLKAILKFDPRMKTEARQKQSAALDVFQKLLEGRLTRNDLGQPKLNAEGQIIGYEVFDCFAEIFPASVIKEFNNNIFFRGEKIEGHLISKILTVYIQLFLESRSDINLTMADIRKESEKIELFIELLKLNTEVDLLGFQVTNNNEQVSVRNLLNHARATFTGYFSHPIGQEVDLSDEVHNNNVVSYYRYLFLDNKHLGQITEHEPDLSNVDHIRLAHSDYAERYDPKQYTAENQANSEYYLEWSFYLSGLTCSINDDGDAKPGTAKYHSPFSIIMRKKIDDLFGKSARLTQDNSDILPKFNGQLSERVQNVFTLLCNETNARYIKLFKKYGVPAELQKKYGANLHKSPLWNADLEFVQRIDPEFYAYRVKFAELYQAEGHRLRGDCMIETYDHLQHALRDYALRPEVKWTLELQNMLTRYGDEQTIQTGILKALATTLELPPVDLLEPQKAAQLLQFRREKADIYNTLVSYLAKNNRLGINCFTHPDIRKLAVSLHASYIPHAENGEFGIAADVAPQYGVYHRQYSAAEYRQACLYLKHNEFLLGNTIADHCAINSFEFRFGWWRTIIHAEHNKPGNGIGAVVEIPSVAMLIDYQHQNIVEQVVVKNEVVSRLIRPAIDFYTAEFAGSKEIPEVYLKAPFFNQRLHYINKTISDLCESAEERVVHNWRESIQELAKFADQNVQIKYFIMELGRILAKNDPKLTEDWVKALTRLGIINELRKKPENSWKIAFNQAMHAHIATAFKQRQPAGQFIKQSYVYLVGNCITDEDDVNHKDLRFYNTLQVCEQRNSSLPSATCANMYQSLVGEVESRRSISVLDNGMVENMGHKYFGRENYETLLPQLQAGLVNYLTQKRSELLAGDQVLQEYTKNSDIDNLLKVFGKYKGVLGKEAFALYVEYAELVSAHDTQAKSESAKIKLMSEIFQTKSIEVPLENDANKNNSANKEQQVKSLVKADSKQVQPEQEPDAIKEQTVASAYIQLTATIDSGRNPVHSNDPVRAKTDRIQQAAAIRARGRVERLWSYSLLKSLITIKYNQEEILGEENERTRIFLKETRKQEQADKIYKADYEAIYAKNGGEIWRRFATQALTATHGAKFQDKLIEWADKQMGHKTWLAPSYEHALTRYITKSLRTGYLAYLNYLKQKERDSATAKFVKPTIIIDKLAGELNKPDVEIVDLAVVTEETFKNIHAELTKAKEDAMTKAVRNLLVPSMEAWAEKIATKSLEPKKPTGLAENDPQVRAYKSAQRKHQQLLENGARPAVANRAGHWVDCLVQYLKSNHQQWNDLYPKNAVSESMASGESAVIEALLWKQFELDNGLRRTHSEFDPNTYDYQATMLYAKTISTNPRDEVSSDVANNDPEFISGISKNNAEKIQLLKNIFEKALKGQKALGPKAQVSTTAYLQHVSAYLTRISVGANNAISLPVTAQQAKNAYANIEYSRNRRADLLQQALESYIDSLSVEDKEKLEKFGTFKDSALLKVIERQQSTEAELLPVKQATNFAELITAITQISDWLLREEVADALKTYCEYGYHLQLFKSQTSYASAVANLRTKGRVELALADKLDNTHDFYEFSDLCKTSNLNELEEACDKYCDEQNEQVLDTAQFVEAFERYIPARDEQQKDNEALATIKASRYYQDFIQQLSAEYPAPSYNAGIVKRLETAQDLYSFTQICFAENQCLPLLEQVKQAYTLQITQAVLDDYIVAKNFENVFVSNIGDVISNFKVYCKENKLTDYSEQISKLHASGEMVGLESAYANFKESAVFAASLDKFPDLDQLNFIEFLSRSQELQALYGKFKNEYVEPQSHQFLDSTSRELSTSSNYLSFYTEKLKEFKQTEAYTSQIKQVKPELAAILNQTTDLYSFINSCITDGSDVTILHALSNYFGGAHVRDQKLQDLHKILGKYVTVRNAELLAKGSKNLEHYEDLMTLMNFKMDEPDSSLTASCKAYFKSLNEKSRKGYADFFVTFKLLAKDKQVKFTTVEHKNFYAEYYDFIRIYSDLIGNLEAYNAKLFKSLNDSTDLGSFIATCMQHDACLNILEKLSERPIIQKDLKKLLVEHVDKRRQAILQQTKAHFIGGAAQPDNKPQVKYHSRKDPRFKKYMKKHGAVDLIASEDSPKKKSRENSRSVSPIPSSSDFSGQGSDRDFKHSINSQDDSLTSSPLMSVMRPTNLFANDLTLKAENKSSSNLVAPASVKAKEGLDLAVITEQLRKLYLNYKNEQGQDYPIPAAGEFADIRENQQRILLCSPMELQNIEQLAGELSKCLNLIAGQDNRWTKMPEQIYLRFCIEGQWVRTRIKIDYSTNKVAIFYDNPYGYDLGNSERRNFEETIKEHCGMLIFKQNNLRSLPSIKVDYSFNNVDQQGKVFNNKTDSEIFTLVNDEVDLDPSKARSRPGSAVNDDKFNQQRSVWRAQYLDYCKQRKAGPVVDAAITSSSVSRSNSISGTSAPKIVQTPSRQASFSLVTKRTPNKNLVDAIDNDTYVDTLGRVFGSYMLRYLLEKDVLDTFNSYRLPVTEQPKKGLKFNYDAVISQLWKSVLALDGSLSKEAGISPKDRRNILILLFMDVVTRYIREALINSNGMFTAKNAQEMVLHVMGKDVKNSVGYLSYTKDGTALRGKCTTDLTAQQKGSGSTNFIAEVQSGDTNQEFCELASKIFNVWCYNDTALQKEAQAAISVTMSSSSSSSMQAAKS